VRSREALPNALEGVGSIGCGAAALRKAALFFVAGAGAGGALRWWAMRGAASFEMRWSWPLDVAGRSLPLLRQQPQQANRRHDQHDNDAPRC